MDQEARGFARRMLAPIVTEFKRDIAQQRANGASEADIEEMLARIESTNRSVMDADQLAYFMELFREAARPLHKDLPDIEQKKAPNQLGCGASEALLSACAGRESRRITGNVTRRGG